jgi:hypothetical protein
MTEISLIVQDVMPGRQSFTKAIKISSDQWELNIWLTERDIVNLKAIRPGPWADRKSLQSGTVARAPVFWSIEDGKLTILVGEDDETWDAAFTLPDTALTDILKAI